MTTVALWTLLLASPWPVVAGETLLARLHTYDIERYDVTVEPGPEGVAVDCRVRLRVLAPGPLRFLISTEVAGLEAARDGRRVGCELGGGLEQLVRLAAPGVRGVPAILTVDPGRVAPGGAVELRFTYVWRPAGDLLAYAADGRIQTHLAGFWVPMMADERFDASVEVRTGGQAVGPGRRQRVDGGWRFETQTPIRVLCLVAGEFEVHGREAASRRLEVLVPPGLPASAPERLLDDLEAVLGQLEVWFGSMRAGAFRLVVEPRARPAPSYCADAFAVVSRAWIAADRPQWLAHLAHECAHLWWGHAVGSPVVGRGGTWLREGLAEWSGLRVAGALAGPEAERALWRARFRAYLGRTDLRRRDGLLFANEATLEAATYLDRAAVPYCRGALVLRRIEHDLGAEAFRAHLRRYAREHAGGSAELGTVRAWDAGVVDYYARTTRLPDLELVDVQAGPGAVRARVRCADAAWPAGAVPVRVETGHGAFLVVTAGDGHFEWRGEGVPVRIVVDPERIHLDPVRSNNVWSR